MGRGEFPTTGLFTTATKVDVEYTYANGVKMFLKTGGGGTRFNGSEGWVYVNRGKLDAEPKAILDSVIGPNEIHLYESNNHMQNFLDCIKNRKDPICNAEIGHRSSTVCHLANIAMLLDRQLKWDPKAELFPGDDEATRMTWRARRSPWIL